MRNIILFNLITLDGYFAGPNGEIEWHRVDEEFNDFAIEQLHTIGSIIFGRVTYQMMAEFWPSPTALKEDPVVAELMNTLPKIVVSRTLQTADWNNTRLVKTDVAGELSRLKQQPGKDLFVFGSADLASTLIRENLIDEYRLLVNPVVLGRGKPLFKDVNTPLQLQFQSSRPFQNGNILLIYRQP